jgi:phosphate transport system substrate-binding protein
MLAVLSCVMVAGAGAASAVPYVPIAGAGSPWSQNAIDQWRRDVSPLGLRVDYAGTGSTNGHRQFLNGTVDFAASEIPFQYHPEDNSAPETPLAGSYAYLPITAGATTFMYNLRINGQRVTNLRLSGLNLAKIFTGVITNWNDAALAADNPGLVLPNRTIVPVVRSDGGAGTTYQLSGWISSQFPDVWNAYCTRVGRATPCGQTSFYPTVPGMIAQSGDLGVAGYVSQGYAEGAIGYTNYSYALNANFPVAKVLNAAGYYTEPNANNVAVSLFNA